MATERYRLLVTDVTEYGDLRCVAGWDLDRKLMVRPEPRPGAFWPRAMTGPAAPFQIGAVVEFLGQSPEPATAYPHFTEDRVVAGPVMPSHITLNATERADYLAATVSASIPDIFAGYMQRTGSLKGFVPEGTPCRSLGAVEVDPSELRFDEDTNKGRKRPRCLLTRADSFLDLPITASNMRELYRTGGIDAIRASFRHASRLHLRVGLARAFSGQPGKCYVQVNGIEIAR